METNEIFSKQNKKKERPLRFLSDLVNIFLNTLGFLLVATVATGATGASLTEEKAQGESLPSSSAGSSLNGYLTSVKLWLGKEAPRGQVGTAYGNERNFVLEGLKIGEIEAYDIQYQKKNFYRGINLRDLIGVMSPLPPSVDMIVLHMDNGLLISVSIQDLTQDREIFLATEYRIEGKWNRDFMPVKNPKGQLISFRGNKMIAGKQYQNSNPDAFNPWEYAGSLAGVELVESRAYYRSMNRIDGRNTSLGHAIYQGRCWNCHQVRGIGGNLGPDLTGLSELKDIKGIQKIYLRVAGPQKKKDPILGHSMPYQKDFTFKESKSLWFWLREIGSGDLAPYQPSYQKSIKWEP